MNNIAVKTFSLIVICLFCGVLLSGIFVPLYSDELITKWSVSRFFLEDQHLVSFFPQCSTMAGRAVSWLFYPAALAMSLVYSHLGPLGIRISAIILTAVWFALLAVWCLKQTNSKNGAIQLLAGLMAFAALGVMPYLWVLSRSEQFMTLPILTFCVAALYFKERKTLQAQCACALFYAMVLSCFFYVHPKSLFFLPFLIAALWFATQTYHQLIRVALLTYAVALFAQVLHESNAIAACTDAPAMQALLAANTLLPGTIFSAPTEFFNAALNNLINFPSRLLSHLTFNPVSQSGWLPPFQGNAVFLQWLNKPITYILFIFVLGTHLISLLALIIQAAIRRFTAPIFLAALLSAADILNVLLFNIQNFYAGTQFVPIAIILAALLFSNPRSTDLYHLLTKRYARALSLSYCATLLTSIISMITLVSLITPTLINNSSSNTATLPGQPLSIPVFNTQSHIDSIKNLGTSCGLSPKHSKNLVLDQMTYFSFIANKGPIHVLYVSEFGYGGDLANGKLLPFLKKLDTSGIITRCEWMPTPFRSVQKSDDMGYCCVNLNDL